MLYQTLRTVNLGTNKTKALNSHNPPCMRCIYQPSFQVTVTDIAAFRRHLMSSFDYA